MNESWNAALGTGSRNPVPVPALAYSDDLSQWLTYRPTDPAGNPPAARHVYDFDTCSDETCRNSTLAPVAARAPSSRARSARTPTDTDASTAS
ncbi:hypothetical protein [Streptomyces sp. NPDC059247]|uniref:hypothetical protein n=1 Tax=Streptomyces sp. NPDC059247 TaxID=3346790 RepID=UPI0036C6967F